MASLPLLAEQSGRNGRFDQVLGYALQMLGANADDEAAHELVRRWVLPQFPRRERDELLAFGWPCEIFVVTPEPLSPNRGASQRRLCEMLSVLTRAGCKIFHASLYPTAHPNDDFAADVGISELGNFFANARASQSAPLILFSDIWNQFQIELAIAAILTRFILVGRPQRLVFDAMDCLYRSKIGFLPEGDLVKLRERERDLHRLADYSIVVSQEERAELHALYDLDLSRIGLVAVMQDIYPKGIAVPFAQRRDICFVGSPHPSNLQAIHYFLREVFPIVAQEAPDIRLHVLGKGMEQAGIDVPMGFADKVEIVGPVADMLVAVAQYRLQVVPIRDGSGIKGKLVESLACNTPVVTTSSGLRGMPARDVDEFLCADDPREFADCVIRLHSDAALWSRQVDFGRRFVEKNFSSAVFQDHVYSLMRTIRRADTVDR